MKILAIYNTCEIGGTGNIPYYIDSIRSLLLQKNVNLKVAISSCQPSDMSRTQITGIFGKEIAYNGILQNLPVSVTFNHTVTKCVEHFGPFDAYLYVDSGITFWDPCHRNDALSNLALTHFSGPYAITAAMPSNDDGRQWWGIQYPSNLDGFILPLGKATNMHCQLFSEHWRQAYGKILPDIFASHCMESVFSLMAAAIRQKVIVSQKVHLLHNHSMDGASIGSRKEDKDRHPMSHTFPLGGLLFKTTKTMDERYLEGARFGFGFEECKDYYLHNPKCFDGDGYSINDDLRAFYAKEVFLKPDEFSYETIPSTFIPEG